MRRALRGLEKTMVKVGNVMGPDLVVGCHDGVLEPRVLREAVGRLQHQHAALRTRVDGQDLVVGGSVPVCVDHVDGDWRWHAEAELGRPLRLHHGEAFRVIQAPGAVILSVHHALVDGTSLLALLRDLLTHSDDVQHGRAATVPCNPLHPAVMDAVSGPAWQDLAGPVAAAVAPYVVSAEQQHLLRQGAVEGPVRSIATFREGTKAGLSRLVAACKLHDVTVGAAAMAAASMTVGHLRAKRGGPELPVGVEVEVDLRRRATPRLPGDRVGFHCGGVRTNTPPDLDFWNLARWLKADVDLDIQRGFPRFSHVLAEQVDWEPRNLPSTWVAVSNLGRFPHRTTYGGLELTGVYGMNGAVPGGPAVILWLRCIGGRLCFNAVGSSPTLDHAALEAISDGFLAQLEHPATVACHVRAA